MEHFSGEMNDRGLVGVLFWEFDREPESALLPDGVLGSHEGCSPIEEISLIGAGNNFVILFGAELLEVLHESLDGRVHLGVLVLYL